ncbi:MAG: hypothetical protein DMG32_08420 [Acidobacteria bacterium]|nr:MAG: hypothetical protein DMG32_08420 [Acidobacteriota bacterium]
MILSHRIGDAGGSGVVGDQPILAPGQSFEYTSGCPLTVPFGSMQGTCQMINDRREQLILRLRRLCWWNHIAQRTGIRRSAGGSLQPIIHEVARQLLPCFRPLVQNRRTSGSLTCSAA